MDFFPNEDSNLVMGFCINLKRRPDRWQQIQNEWKKFSNNEDNLFRVDAIDTGDWRGCGQSHLLCVEHAKRNKYPWIFVLEDDVVFKPNAKEIWKQQIAALKKAEKCDIFRCSVSGALGITSVGEGLLKIKDGSGLFATIYFESSYDRVLQWRSDYQNIDRWLGQDRSLNMLVYVPFLASTSDGKSDIRNTEVKDSLIIAKIESNLMDVAHANRTKLPAPTNTVAVVTRPIQHKPILNPTQTSIVARTLQAQNRNSIPRSHVKPVVLQPNRRNIPNPSFQRNRVISNQ